MDSYLVCIEKHKRIHCLPNSEDALAKKYRDAKAAVVFCGAIVKLGMIEDCVKNAEFLMMIYIDI